MSSPTPRAARARAAAEHRPRAPAPRKTILPVVALVVAGLVAVGVALLAGGDEGDGGGDVLATAEVTVRGDPLPPLADGPDPAVGSPAPGLEGVSEQGNPTTVEPTGEPTLLAFLAHWCPHCQAELPNLVTMAEEGQLDDVRPVIVATGTDDSAPNYPPAPWLEDEGWDGNVILDDEDYTAAAAYGLAGYPYLVLVDADGDVIARASGELGLEGLISFVEQAG